MKKAPLYSRTPRREAAPPAAPAAADPAPEPAARSPGFLARRGAPFWLATGAMLASLVLVLGLALALRPAPRVITQHDIDLAVRQSLETQPLPAAAARAYAAVAPSVVRVIGLVDEHDHGHDRADKRALERSLGTGIVIVEDGTILTSLHVVAGARKVRVTFADGHESAARVVSTQPQNDLAVLKALSLPDDLQPVTMRSLDGLKPGDEVIAIGHPFGIGPSVSAGIVSGLEREFRAEHGNETLEHLIQFDAAANPGNSGGPLVTMDGSVVGVVTAILNPGEEHTFIGIGFAVPIENAARAAGMPPF
ncbi:MAG: peptidase S1 [Rubrivivax sp. SCN 70-15]|nr:MAG: peptidase S1 [Rubrivivax sp. SCN 70-15]